MLSEIQAKYFIQATGEDYMSYLLILLVFSLLLIHPGSYTEPGNTTLPSLSNPVIELITIR